jgi:hypothetical protein
MNNKSINKSHQVNNSRNYSNALNTSDIDIEIKSGEENIDEDDIVDESEFNLNIKKGKNEMDMEEKKNKMLYDD